MKQTVYITDMAMLLKDFFETYLPKERGVSGHTIRSYSATFQSLYSFFKGSKGTVPISYPLRIYPGRASMAILIGWKRKRAIRCRPAIRDLHPSRHSAIMHNTRISITSQNGRKFYQSSRRRPTCLICLSLPKRE